MAITSKGMKTRKPAAAIQSMRVDYIFTTFPLLSETFYQREIRALLALGVRPNLYSLWGGESCFDGQTVALFRKWALFSLLWWLPYWVLRRPAVMLRTLRRLLASRPPSGLNFAENMLGLGFALTHAHRFRIAADEVAVMHAAWATAPGTAAQLIAGLTGRSFCQGAHAYDIFEHDGDWWLESKLADAAAIVTSTEAARSALLKLGAKASSTHLIRRGLNALPELHEPRSPRRPLRLLSVGRLIEKKGFDRQLRIYQALLASGLPFQARIVGGGQMYGSLQRTVETLGLESVVRLEGELTNDETARCFRWADVFLFTGVIADSGDRDGLPNVIPEAMAAGIPVLSTRVGGVAEALHHGVNGILLEVSDTLAWVAELRRLSEDDAHYGTLREAARAWVEREFDAKRNAMQLLQVWRGIAHPDGREEVAET
jgi:glycosyltransferase involved in cell wall biosynthesis